jgi:hypothetical protein
MDPIHPIIPIPPAIPTVTPAPLIGRIDRDNPHHDAGEDKRRRRRPQPQDGPSSPDQTYDVGGDDDSGLHIDLTA